MDDEAGCTLQSAGGKDTWTPISVSDMSRASAEDAAWTPKSMGEMWQEAEIAVNRGSG